MTKVDIIKYLEENYGDVWTYGGKLAREVRELTGTKESVVERRCRELVNENVLEKKLVQIDGVGPKVVMYRIQENPLIEADLVINPPVDNEYLQPSLKII